MKMNYENSYQKCQVGAGLIEVMVSLLILAVGLLGVLSLQANGLNSNQRAEFVGQAQVLAQDMADKIWAFGSVETNGNRGAIDTPDLVVTGLYGAIDTQTSQPDPGCTTAGCTPANTVNYDNWQWQQLFSSSGLPGVRGTVVWNDPVYTITVYWDQDRTGATGTNCDSNDKSSTGNLTCFQMLVRP